MVSVTLDTSAYISALNSNGRASRVLLLARAGEIRLDVSEPILRETFQVLREKFEWDGYSIQHASQKIRAIANLVAPTQTLEVVKEDSPDNRILECAVEAGSGYIIIWDKDLLRLKTYSGLGILTPAQFLELPREAYSGSRGATSPRGIAAWRPGDRMGQRVFGAGDGNRTHDQQLGRL